MALDPAQPNFLSRAELTNWLKANGKKDGVYRLRAAEQSQIDLIDPEDLKNWLRFEEGVAGRLASSDNVRWEYAAVYWDEAKQALGVVGVEGAEMAGGAINFIDRRSELPRLLPRL